MLFPKNTKYKKAQKGVYPSRISTSGNLLSFGDYGLKCIGCGILTSAQIEAARKVIMRKTKRAGRFWVRVFPNIPVTRKPIEIRMGKGKGAVDHWIFKIHSGRILFELSDLPRDVAIEALQAASIKLPVRTQTIQSVKY